MCPYNPTEVFTNQHEIRRAELRIDNVLVQSGPVYIKSNEAFFIFVENFGPGLLVWKVIKLDYPIIGLPPVASRTYATWAMPPRQNIVKRFFTKTGGWYSLALSREDASIPVSASGVIQVAPNLEHTLPLP